MKYLIIAQDQTLRYAQNDSFIYKEKNAAIYNFKRQSRPTPDDEC